MQSVRTEWLMRSTATHTHNFDIWLIKAKSYMVHSFTIISKIPYDDGLATP